MFNNFLSQSLQVQNYKDEVKAQAEELLRKGIPESILKLNKILESPQFKNRVVIDVKQDINIPIPDPIIFNDVPPAKKTKFDNSISKDGTRVLIFPSGAVAANKFLTDLIDIIKPHIRKLVEDAIVVSDNELNNNKISGQYSTISDKDVDFVHGAQNRRWEQFWCIRSRRDTRRGSILRIGSRFIF